MKCLTGHPYVDVDDMDAVPLTLGEFDDEVGPDTRELMTDGEFKQLLGLIQTMRCVLGFKHMRLHFFNCVQSSSTPHR